MTDYEKKYKEALQKAGDLLEYYRKPEYEEILSYAKHDLESIFPELMTEDEKIRKTLIDLHKSTVAINGIKGERIVAWLEKQGGRVATEEKIIVPKFRVGDMIRHKDGGATYTIMGISGGCYRGIGWALDIAAADGSGDYELVDQLTAEDEQYLTVCKNALAKYQVSDQWDAMAISRWLEDKLRSNRNRNYWKPSEEQMDAVKHAKGYFADNERGNYYRGQLEDLLEQLEKL